METGVLFFLSFLQFRFIFVILADHLIIQKVGTISLSKRGANEKYRRLVELVDGLQEKERQQEQQQHRHQVHRLKFDYLKLNSLFSLFF
jgi:hypothetical protein